MNNAQNVFNLIRLQASKEYQDTVPALKDKSPIGDVGTPILDNPLIFKEFSTLLGAFMRIEVLKNVWENPLAELVKSNGSPLGEYSAEVTNNPITPVKYDALHPEKVLNYAMTSDKIAYYARNVKELFKVSIAYEDMQGAFNSYEKFNDYVSMKIATLESGLHISQFNHIFEAIVSNYNAGVFVESAFHINDTTTDYAGWTTEVKNLVDYFQYPSSEFNNYGSLQGANGDFVGWTDKKDIYVIATIDWLNETNVNFLASLFNLSKAEIDTRIIKVPSFSYTYVNDDNQKQTVSTPIKCMVCDKNIFKFKTDLEMDNTFFNPETLVTNYFKHWWATYGISPFANCVVFTSGEGSLTGATVKDYGQADGEPDVNIKTANGKQTITLDFRPEGYVMTAKPTINCTSIISSPSDTASVSSVNSGLSDILTVDSYSGTDGTVTFKAISVTDDTNPTIITANLNIDTIKVPLTIVIN